MNPDSIRIAFFACVVQTRSIRIEVLVRKDAPYVAPFVSKLIFIEATNSFERRIHRSDDFFASDEFIEATICLQATNSSKRRIIF